MLLLSSLSALSQTVSYSYSDLVSRLTNIEYLATLPVTGDRCALFSSYDRSSYRTYPSCFHSFKRLSAHQGAL